MGDISDYIDASKLDEDCEVTEGEEDKEEEEDVEEEEEEKKRGWWPDISWRELDLFRNDKHFFNSKLIQEIKEIMTKKKVYNNDRQKLKIIVANITNEPDSNRVLSNTRSASWAHALQSKFVIAMLIIFTKRMQATQSQQTFTGQQNKRKLF